MEKGGLKVEIRRADTGRMATVALVGQPKAISEASRLLPWRISCELDNLGNKCPVTAMIFFNTGPAPDPHHVSAPIGPGLVMIFTSSTTRVAQFPGGSASAASPPGGGGDEAGADDEGFG